MIQGSFIPRGSDRAVSCISFHISLQIVSFRITTSLFDLCNSTSKFHRSENIQNLSVLHSKFPYSPTAINILLQEYSSFATGPYFSLPPLTAQRWKFVMKTLLQIASLVTLFKIPWCTIFAETVSTMSDSQKSCSRLLWRPKHLLNDQRLYLFTMWSTTEKILVHCTQRLWRYCLAWSCQLPSSQIPQSDTFWHVRRWSDIQGNTMVSSTGSSTGWIKERL